MFLTHSMINLTSTEFENFLDLQQSTDKIAIIHLKVSSGVLWSAVVVVQNVVVQNEIHSSSKYRKLN